jgi:hypothetical protein
LTLTPNGAGGFFAGFCSGCLNQSSALIGFDGVGKVILSFWGGILGFTLSLSIFATSCILISLPKFDPFLGGGAAGLFVILGAAVVFPHNIVIILCLLYRLVYHNPLKSQAFCQFLVSIFHFL